MSKASKTDWERLAKLDDQDIDTGDMPELGDDFLRRAELRVPVKQAVTIRLDADVLEWFRGQRAGYQTRINQLLRRDMQAQQSLLDRTTPLYLTIKAQTACWRRNVSVSPSFVLIRYIGCLL